MIAFVIFSIVLNNIIMGESCRAGRQLIRSGGLTAYEKQAIVDAHNRLRQSVALGQISRQPPAANMMEMVWDEELAARAQNWANECQPAHDKQTQRDVGRFPVGQNIAATWTTRTPSSHQDYEPEFNKQIKAWFDEVRVYGFKPIGYTHGTGHYSQLVWGETSKVGCGFTVYYDRSKGYTKLYVCNYGPGGNVIGSKPYHRGLPSCNSFGLSESAKYSGLCVFGYESNYEDIPLDNEGDYGANVIPDSYDEPQTYYNYDDGSYKQHYNNLGSWSETNSQPAAKPFINFFNDASNVFTKAKQNTAQTFSIFKPNGFKFGLYI